MSERDLDFVIAMNNAEADDRLRAAQDASREILSGAEVDIADPFEIGDWSEVALRLRDSGYEPTWLEARAAILAVDPDADA